jgi:hypothetical protein
MKPPTRLNTLASAPAPQPTRPISFSCGIRSASGLHRTSFRLGGKQKAGSESAVDTLARVGLGEYVQRIGLWDGVRE